VLRALVLIGTAVAVAGAGAAAPPRVVPWLGEHPVKASAHPPLAPACAARAVRARLFLQGATGSLVGGVDLINAGPRPCALLGRPTISFTGAAATTTRVEVKELPRSPEPPDVLADPPGSLRALAPGKSASVSLWWSNWCGPGSVPTGSPGAPPSGLELTLPGGTSLVVPLTQAPRCDAPQDPSLVSVGPFTPTTRRLPESSRLPLRAAIAGRRPVHVKPGLRAFLARRGALLPYRVAVTNVGTRAFRFAGSTCPVYVEQLGAGPPQVYVLNCRPAGAIAAGATVVFAMQLRIPADAPFGIASLTWELAPRTYQAPFAPAAVWIER
jgi:hypothetical protein